ncbi:MAG: dihydrolipoamide dehydrogenase [Gammaproteobacteria bacterium SG8_30]|nr:MAG: dihydrolipoamide dehydrogenase [Gammaproteobacteria bacterium SG8_30]
MTGPVEQRVPDLGDFADVEVIEVLVKPGDVVAAEHPLITLETDKATMDVPATRDGTVREVLLSRGDRVSKGTLILTLDAAGADAPAADEAPLPGQVAEAAPPAAAPVSAAETIVSAGEPAADLEAGLVVLGAGPGGYTAAFRAADLGLDVLLVDRWPQLGGVCLNVGCIPSKALLHAAKVIEDVEAMAEHGLAYGDPQIDIGRLRSWKNRIVGKLTAGLAILAKQRKVRVVRGFGRFVSPHRLEIVGPDGGVQVVGFGQCIVAAGSEPMRLPGMPEDPRIIDSTGALDLGELPTRMLVIGGGIIGLEMACVYDSLGSRVSVAELTPGLMPGCDPDLVRPLQKRIAARYERIMTATRVTGVEAREDALHVSFEGAAAPAESQSYDRVLVAVGRVPNGRLINADRAGIRVDDRGFIPVDRQMRTSVAHIFAIGDIAGQPMLAHKATHEGKVAAEVAAGHKSAFDARVIPSVAYTDPEIAWVGVTEIQARADGRSVEKGLFPWMASGRSLALNRDEGFTKLLFDPDTRRVLGGGIVGPSAGDLIAEVALAIEMGADAADIGLTIHPHPTLSETVAFAAEAFEGTLTDLYAPKRRKA